MNAGQRRRRRRRRGGGGGHPGGHVGGQPGGQPGQTNFAPNGQGNGQGAGPNGGPSGGPSDGPGGGVGDGQPVGQPLANGQHGGHPQGGQRGGHQGGHQGGRHGSASGSHAGRGASSQFVSTFPPLPEGTKAFEDLTSIDPQPRVTLEYRGCPDSCRLIDLFCPIGRGQRGMIVSPPKAGKTTLLKDIGLAVLRNHPDIELILLLVDERPEEVTDFRRTFENALKPSALDAEMLARAGVAPAAPTEPLGPPIAGAGQVWANSRCRIVASSNDHGTERHIAVSTQTMEYCKRQVRQGKHVFVLLDSLTRLGRAFNQSRKHANSGRTLTGGLDSKALEVPRQIFGSARCVEEGGSLTILATCLVDTGSAADQVIFEEFKGSGNMELILDRKISEKRLFPAINLAESGTRKENLLLTDQEFKTMAALRRRLLAMPPHVQVEQLIAAMKRFPTNAALVGQTQQG
ncbi:MAG: hypothetical protein SFY96_11510 [Planctomycetota bacterium]|nr:hypothetical protein [Planctomycetota bacterium]